MKVTFYLNDILMSFDVKENEYLADTLRKSGLKSIRLGCNETSCGACTVLIDNKPVLSCGILTGQVEGRHVITVEGIQDEALKIANCFADEGADQCGFCNVGYALVIYALKKELHNPSDDEIKDYIVGNLCRCTGYQSQLKAIRAYLEDK